MLIVETEKALQMNPRCWLITGVAGFVGSNLLLRLLGLGQTVVGLDNFSTGHAHNIEAVKRRVTSAQWQRFKLINGDICDLKTCQAAMIGVDIVLHQAALGSVPRSLLDPISTHNSNINGFLNVLVSARDAKVMRLVYAASSSTYGDHPGLPKVESEIGIPLSPYAVTKYVDELYANVFGRCYQTPTIGLRYFNVFGPYQDPEGAYAAVIPLWFKNIIRGESVYINGDGETSRDFCFVNNVVQANLLAAVTQNRQALNQVYNIAVGQRTTLTGLYEAIREVVQKRVDVAVKPPVYREFREGDIRHSLADVSKAQKFLGYIPTHTVKEGLVQTADYYFSLFLDNQARHHPGLQEIS